MRRRLVRIAATWCIATAALAASAAPPTLSSETVGTKFRRAIAAVDATCRERKIGPYLDPSDPEYRSKAPLRNCEILKVPAFNLATIKATPEGKFAYSIQLPPPLDKPQVAFKPGMTGEQYVQALCAKEAGDFVFETASGVDRLLQLRPSPRPWRYALGSYSEELPNETYLAVHSEPALRLVAPVMRQYLYLEMPSDPTVHKNKSSTPYWLFYRDPAVAQHSPTYGVNSKPLQHPTSRYAYVWRGVERDGARELGILGGELIVLDLQRSRVMAVRRDFAIYTVDERSMDRVLYSARGCRSYSDEGVNFLSRVLKPTVRAWP